MANRIAGITVEIGGDTTKLTSALKTVNTQIKSTQTQLKDVNKLLKLDPTNTTLLTQKQKLLTSAISDTKEKLTTLKTAAKQANEQLQNGEITQEQYDALQREIVATEQELKNLADEAAESNAALLKIESVGEKFETVGTKITSVGTTLTKTVTTAVAGLATAAVATTSSFETSMSKVKSLISSSSTDLEGDIDMLEEKAREAGETTKFSASEAADAMSYMGLAGWSASEMVDGLDGILNLAAASEMDLGTACDIVTDYLSAFGMEASQSSELVDIMAYAMSNSNTTTEQLGEAYKNCATTATQLGWDVDDVTASLMVMADNGAKGGEAGTALNSIMTRLANNTSGCTDLLEEYGIEVYDASGNLNDLGDIMLGMQDIWSDLNDEEKANLAYKVAGKNAESDLMAVLGDSTGALAEYTDGINNCTGTSQEMADIMQDNLSGQLTILKSQLQELAISFGEILMPYVRKAVEWIQSLVDKLNGMDEGTRKTIIKIGLLAASIGPLLVIIGTLVTKVGTAMKGISSLGTSVLKVVGHIKTGTGVAGKLATAIGGISAPVLAVVAVIAVLVAAFVTLWKNNDEFREKITAIWNGIVSKVTEFVDGIKERLTGLCDSFGGVQNVISTLKSVWEGFCNFLAPIFTGAFQAVSTVLSTVLDVITGLLDVFIGIFTGDWEQAWTGIKEIFSGIWDGIKGILSTVLETIKGVVNTVLSWFGTSWDECWSNIKTFFENIWNGISNFFSGVLTGIQTAATTVWNAISTFFSTIFNAIYSVVSTVWNTIYSTITGIWNSIWTVIEPLVTAFGYLFDTIFKAIKLVISNVMTAIKNKITTVWNAIVSFLSPILNGIKTTITTIWNSIKTALTTVMNGIKTVVTTVWNAIKTAISTVLNSIKTVVSSVWNSIKSVISTVMNSIKSSVSNIWSSIKNGISNKVSGIYNSIKSGFDKAVNYIKGLVSKAKTWGSDMISNIVSGIKSKISDVADAVTGVANKIKSVLGFSLPEDGPLSDADEYMPDFMQLMSKGIVSNMSGVIDKAKELASSVSGVLSDSFSVPDVSLLTSNGKGLTNAGITTDNSKTTNMGGITIQVNGYSVKDDNELAKTIANKISRMINVDDSVYV